MFDSKKYHREYMEKYRKNNPLNTEQREKANAASRASWRKRRESDPEWVIRERERHKLLMRRKRENPEFRKAQYVAHTQWVRKNKDYINEQNKIRNDKPENKLKRKKHLLKKHYGLSHEEYISKIQSQAGNCPICQKPLERAAVDHNHETGQIRDILCYRCNLRVGTIENAPELVAPIQSYLAKWKNIQQIS